MCARKLQASHTACLSSQWRSLACCWTKHGWQLQVEEQVACEFHSWGQRLGSDRDPLLLLNADTAQTEATGACPGLRLQ